MCAVFDALYSSGGVIIVKQNSNLTIWKPTVNTFHTFFLPHTKESSAQGWHVQKSIRFTHTSSSMCNTCSITNFSTSGRKKHEPVHHSQSWPDANQNSQFWTAGILVHKPHSSNTSCCPGSTIEHGYFYVNILSIVFTVRAGPSVEGESPGFLQYCKHTESQRYPSLCLEYSEVEIYPVIIIIITLYVARS